MITTALGFIGRNAELSKAEKQWCKTGPDALLKLEVFTGASVVANLFEWCTFLLPGGRYTPDFQVLLADGRVVFVEVKASRFQGSYRDSRSKLRACASLNPWFFFVMAQWVAKEKKWEIELIPPDHKGWVNGVFTSVEE